MAETLYLLQYISTVLHCEDIQVSDIVSGSVAIQSLLSYIHATENHNSAGSENTTRSTSDAKCFYVIMNFGAIMYLFFQYRANTYSLY